MHCPQAPCTGIYQCSTLLCSRLALSLKASSRFINIFTRFGWLRLTLLELRYIMLYGVVVEDMIQKSHYVICSGNTCALWNMHSLHCIADDYCKVTQSFTWASWHSGLKHNIL